jgi:SAM-dependent methyltransferase
MDFSKLAGLASGYAEARAIQAAVELRLFDALDQSRDAGGVAHMIKTDARATELLLDALSSIGLLSKSGAIYSLNETSATYLTVRSPKYLGGMISFDAATWGSWEKLAETVRTGKPARTPDMYQNGADDTERFISAMDSLVRARGDAELVVENFDLTGVETLIDVGSGPGTYPIHFCRKYASLKATIFDLPGTLRVTERFVRDAGLGDRIRLVAGDYRNDPIPGEYQTAFLSNIIHSEGEAVNAALMSKVYGVLRAGGRIVIKDHILDATHTQPGSGAVFSLLMLLTTEQGKCYSYSEVKDWLAAAGFKDVREIELPPPLTSSLVIGTK